jgi:hypothetical protein
MTDLNNYEVPDLSIIALCVNKDAAVNGNEESVNIVKNIEEFHQDFTKLVECVKSTGKPPPSYNIFVPDFWHVAYGRAKCMPAEEAELLWGSVIVARRIGNEFEAQVTYNQFRYKHPGCTLLFK